MQISTFMLFPSLSLTLSFFRRPHTRLYVRNKITFPLMMLCAAAVESLAWHKYTQYKEAQEFRIWHENFPLSLRTVACKQQWQLDCEWIDINFILLSLSLSTIYTFSHFICFPRMSSCQITIQCEYVQLLSAIEK